MYDEPLAYFLTWVTYGTWLPGDPRGWVEYRHGWQLPDRPRYLESKARMTEDACYLSPAERNSVELQLFETCQHRGWRQLAVNCRSNHLHAVISAPDTRPKKVRIDLKAWATRRLRECHDADREHWWAERGSIRFVRSELQLETVIDYVLDQQCGRRFA